MLCFLQAKKELSCCVSYKLKKEWSQIYLKYDWDDGESNISEIWLRQMWKSKISEIWLSKISEIRLRQWSQRHLKLDWDSVICVLTAEFIVFVCDPTSLTNSIQTRLESVPVSAWMPWFLVSEMRELEMEDECGLEL